MNGILKSLLEMAFGGGIFDGLKDILAMNPETKFPTAWHLMISIYNDVFVPLGLGVMLIWFVCSFLEKTTHEDFTFEKWFLELGKLLIAQYLIVHGLEILATFMSLGIALFNKLETLNLGGLDTPAGAPQELYKTAWHALTGKDWDEKISVLSAMGYLVPIIIMWLGSLISQIIIRVIAYSRIFELFVRGALAPLALADFYGQGMHGTGFKFLKSYFAIAIQGFIIYIILTLLNIILYDVLAANLGADIHLFAFIGIYFSVTFAAIALILKSLSLSKELIGAN